MKKKFGGIIPPVSTVFDSEGNFDANGMKLVIDFLVYEGVDGLLFLGSGGEFTQLSTYERKEIAQFVIQYVDNRLPVLIGTGSTNTREVIELSHHAFSHGADAVVVINHYYWNLSEDSLLFHFQKIADAIDGPMLLYNFPTLTGQDISPEIALRLVEENDNIVGIKDTVDSTAHIRDMILTVKKKYPDFLVLAGFDDHLFNTLSLGGDGSITASVNFAPRLSVDLYHAFRNEKYQKAIDLHKKLSQMPLLYNLEAPFLNVVKEATKMRGINISTYVQPPSKVIDDEKKEQMKNILRRVGL